MTPYEVYFDTKLSIDDFARTLRALLNLADTNRTPHQRDQRRDGANYGGTYYLFEVVGFELILLANVGEVAIPERYDHSLYLIVQGGSDEANSNLAQQIQRLAEREGIVSCVDSLST